MWRRRNRRWIIGGVIVLPFVLLAGALARAQPYPHPGPHRSYPGPRLGGGFMPPPRPQPPVVRRDIMRPPYYPPVTVRPHPGRRLPGGPVTGHPPYRRTIIITPPPVIYGGYDGTLPPVVSQPTLNPLTDTVAPPEQPSDTVAPAENPLTETVPITPKIIIPSTLPARNVLPQVTRIVTPKVNKVGRPIAKAGPVTRRNVALRANQEVINRTRELKKAVDKAGLCPGRAAGSVTSMSRPVTPTKEVLVALSPTDPKARSSALVSILGCSLCAYGAAPSCCTDTECTCGGSATDEAGCPSCVRGSVFQYLVGIGKLNPSDLATFDNFYNNHNWAGLKNFLNSKGVPAPVGDMLMGQIDVAQKFEQYKKDVQNGAGAGQLAYDLGQFNASVQEYEAKVQAAGNGGLINPGDFVNRLQIMGDLSKKMDVINQFANVRDQATQPWSPDPSGGLTLSGGPIMILNDPDLPGGAMTQLGPDLVAIGTGGQGEFQVQVGSPSDVGYPLITNVLPLPEASTAAVERSSDQALVINPATTGATINFVIDQTPYSLAAGQAQPLAGQPSWVIAFDRGGQFGQARYTLAPGGYSFTVTASGWDLVQKTYKVILDNSANANDFNYVLEGQAGTVPGRQKQEINSKLPIVLTFDRGDGREVAHKELEEGTYTIGIEPQAKLLDLFPGPVPTTAPTTALASAVSSTPTTAAPTPPSPSSTDLP